MNLGRYNLFIGWGKSNPTEFQNGSSNNENVIEILIYLRKDFCYNLFINRK